MSAFSSYLPDPHISTRVLKRPKSGDTGKWLAELDFRVQVSGSDGNNIIRNGVINFGAHLVDRQEYRPVFRGVIWIALFICALMDGALGDYLISGPDHFSDVFCWNCPPTPLQSSDWAFTGGFLVFQALLILILIRTRRKSSQMAVVPK